MGKRSNFARRPQDAYDTPFEALEPLLPHLPVKPFGFVEPCAGTGVLAMSIELMLGHARCVDRFDVKPRGPDVRRADALVEDWPPQPEMFITNPPWTREILHPMIERFRNATLGTWLLFDADWMHTKQATPYLPFCRKIVSVGRVKWIPGTKQTGKDNCCWYWFVREPIGITTFVGRQ